MSTKGDKEMQSLRIEPSQRWVRAQVGGEFVVDCKRPLLVWEHKKYPTYFFPRQDVRMDWLEEGTHTSSRTFWHLTPNDGQRVERAAYHYPDQPELEGYITLPWHKVDHWFEEEEEVFLGRSITQHKNVSDETAHTIDEEVRSFIDRNYERSERILKENIDKLHAMSQALIKYETIDSGQIDEIMSGKPPTPPEGWNDDSEPGDSGGLKVDLNESRKKDSKDSDGTVGGPAGQH